MNTTKGNCTFISLPGNEIETHVKVICPGYEDEFLHYPRSFSFNEIVDMYNQA